MLPKISEITPLDQYILQVKFDDGYEVLYDLKSDMDSIPDFAPLAQTANLWRQSQVDTSRTCVYWTDRIDLASDTIYEYGQPVRVSFPPFH